MLAISESNHSKNYLGLKNNTMDLITYQNSAIKTIKYLGNDNFDTAHMCIGMSSELNELRDAYNSGDKIAIAEELADIMWYAVNLATIRKISIDNAYQATEIGYRYDDIEYAVSKLNDACKKFIVYNDRKKETLEIKWLNEIIKICYNFYFGFGHIDLPTALQRNIDKLHNVRYKNGYSDEAAQNRDIAAERKALEGI